MTQFFVEKPFTSSHTHVKLPLCYAPYMCQLFFCFFYLPNISLYSGNYSSQMRLISKHTHTRIFSSNCKKYTKCDYKVNLLGLHRRDSDVCVVCKLVNQIINILPRLQLEQQQQQTEIETCQTIQLQLCNKRLEQDRERERGEKQTKRYEIK